MGCVFHTIDKYAVWDSFGCGCKEDPICLQRQCRLLGIRDPAMERKLFDSLVVPIRAMPEKCVLWVLVLAKM